MAQRMNLVIVGHMDHGKSTVVGRLLADAGFLPDGKLQQVKERCVLNSRPFEYAFLVDVLKEEQAQGITIDSARIFFKTQKRHYMVMDAPGHTDLLRNMVTGATSADAAVVVIDVNAGVQENTRRHARLLPLLGVGQVLMLVNKMDLVGFAKEPFEAIKKEYDRFLSQLNIRSFGYIPVSAREGDCLTRSSLRMPWYHGPTLLGALDELSPTVEAVDGPFRMPVQDVYMFTDYADSRSLIAGTPTSGVVDVGDELVFYPSGKTGSIRTIERFGTSSTLQGRPRVSVALTLQELIEIARGQLAVKAVDRLPCVASRIRVNLFWLGSVPMASGREYTLKIGTDEVEVWMEPIDAHSCVQGNEVVECILRTARPIVFDLAGSLTGAGRFVVVDDRRISGGGVILEALSEFSVI